jgi:CPA1 family monovalent cation:H+ antiporter
MLVAILLLQVSRRLAVPYPTMLAAAGVVVAALPWAPAIAIEPHLAMALFIAPALLDAAYDFPPQALRRYWMPLVALAAVAVVLTTAAVAWAGVAWAGMPLAAAVALGAIVSPPDAAAAVAMLTRFSLPRSTVTVLKGESLLNDAIALLIYGAAVGAVSKQLTFGQLSMQLALAVPGGILLGIVCARIVIFAVPYLIGTIGNILFSFIATFATWILAERLQLSAILALVAFGMTLARYVPRLTPARDRVHAYAVWEVCVFLLNVLAFLLVGLQARVIVGGLDRAQLTQALGFAGGVFAIVVIVRVVWVFLYNRMVGPVYRRIGRRRPTLAQAAVASWCGMRGLVTLATALALPEAFPARDLIVLSALAVVLGTLILQGLTLGPLIRLLGFAPDTSLDGERSQARLVLLDAALESLRDEADEAADSLRAMYESKRRRLAEGGDLHDLTQALLRQRGIEAQRAKLHELRYQSAIDEDLFHEIEDELDRAELALSPRERFELLEG